MATSELYVRNRQRTRPINTRLLEQIASELIARTWPAEFHVGVLLVGSREITRLNEAFLQHAGPTDVIAFGYADHRAHTLHGEVFVCVDEALVQAHRFGTTWQKEVVRYLAHGLLHFQGYEDGTTRQRRRMKVVENALVREMSRQFCLSRLGRKPRLRR